MKSLPSVLRNESTDRLLREVRDCIPEGVSAYLYGGAARNSLYHAIFQEEFPLRDFDIIILGPNTITPCLIEKGFSYKKPPTDVIAKLSKANSIHLDFRFEPNTTIEEVIQRRANFTINGCAIPLNHLWSSEWKERSFFLPTTISDLTEKKLRLNKVHPTDLWAAIRFISKGFTAPSKGEVEQLVTSFREISQEIFERDRSKVINYVGSEGEVRRIAREILGLEFDVLKSTG